MKKRTFSPVLLIAATVLSSTACTPAPQSDSRISAAQSDTHSLGFKAFRNQAHREEATGIFIVDGDIPLASESELRAYYEEHFTTKSFLIVNQQNGQDDVWSDEMKHRLTYCISNDFGRYHEKVRLAMQTASSAWMNAGDVSFIHVAAEDDDCTAANPRVLFDINKAAVDASYAARAFFPSSPRWHRNILIKPNELYTSSRELAGLMAHELGHVLGFRHEHIHHESGGQCHESSGWRTITDYDARSIMHYAHVFCGGSGRMALTLSPLDIEGIKTLYGQGKFCGDGIVDSSTATPRSEQCDDGNNVNGDGCRIDCTLEICGDGIKDPQEICDDGNTEDGDGCRANCTVPRCGDYILDPDEECERFHPENEYECSIDCTYVICGDGIREGEEACDDGNTEIGDGCSNDCSLEFCGDGILNEGEECEPNHPDNEGICRANCTYMVCGDGIRDAEEACDDGNSNDNDKCRTDCTVPRCGDQIVDRGETCDDGNTVDGDGCNRLCKVEGCTDGLQKDSAGKCVSPPVEILSTEAPPSCQAQGPLTKDNSSYLGAFLMGLTILRRRKKQNRY
ncbi:MAG: DUF4215 domain-containing protein [Myxococcota bacterium]|nr:DUF4215 domain-containing protein [Myxococcota bacterium]